MIKTVLVTVAQGARGNLERVSQALDAAGLDVSNVLAAGIIIGEIDERRVGDLRQLPDVLAVEIEHQVVPMPILDEL